MGGTVQLHGVMTTTGDWSRLKQLVWIRTMISDHSQDQKIVYEASNLVFDGTNYIDTGVYLYSEDNINRNFRITVTGLKTDASKGSDKISNRCIIGSMYEESPYPGFVVRAFGDGINGELVVRDGSSIDIVIERINGNIYITGVAPSNFVNNIIFNIPVTLGCELDTNNQPYRYMGGRIDHIVIEWL